MSAVERGPLDLEGVIEGRRLLLFGGTGFLGKVWLGLVLWRYPRLGHVYMVVRPKGTQDPEARFWASVAPSPCFDPLRERLGAAFDDFLREKVTPIPGDVSRPYGGVPETVRDQIRGRVDALVSAAGVVDFNPPLDEGLNVNAFGMQSLVTLARDLGCRFLHTSTCYVAGDRTGQVDEVDPRQHPFPKHATLDGVYWNPEREIAECVDICEGVRHRLNDSFRQTLFLDQARQNLVGRGEPARGTALEDELRKVRRRYESQALIDAGLERARFWGWHNTYTYTKSIGEQVLASSGLTFTIVRPAVIESAVSFPRAGWCEGINTTAPLIYLALKGVSRFPSRPDAVLDVIPVDMVATGMVLALGELLEGTQKPVYQVGTSDTNGITTYRLIELTALAKRQHYRDHGTPLEAALHRAVSATPVSTAHYEAYGPGALAGVTRTVSGWLRKAGDQVLSLKPLTDPASAALDGLASANERTAYVVDQFVPFMATHSYRFSTSNTRAAWARLEESQREGLVYAPWEIDWKHYMLDIHVPGLSKNVFPEIDERANRPRRPLRRHDDLMALLDEVAEVHDLAPALGRLEEDGIAVVTYRRLRERVLATAARLVEAGLERGDRVLLAGANHPDWPVAWFGVVRAGGVVVPLDPGLDPEGAANIARAARVRSAILDPAAAEKYGDALGVPVHPLHEVTADGPTDVPVVHFRPADVASVLFTSGTTGQPKGVMLTHENLTSLLASLGNVFQLGPDDRVLSVLPLHHTFEFSCGLLLPLSHGARVIYLDAITGDRLAEGLHRGRITAMVGVPALWQLLERRITNQLKDQGPLVERAFDVAMDLNRAIGRTTGVDVGKLFFGRVHQRLGGNIRVLISGGAALPKETHAFFAGLGLHLSEGYGLTEASPVLTVAVPSPGAKPGSVGKAIPGVELRILDPDAAGVGEVLARGPNVMAGYFENPEATARVLDADGWLHTGDLGKLDHKGRLTLVGRAKEVVVTAAGENIYLDDVESRLGALRWVKEYGLTGLPDPRGGERLGLLAVPDEAAEPGLDRASLHARARQSVRDAVQKLPAVQRPTVVHLVDADLPRTATRKIKRNDLRKVLERIENATAAGVARRPGRSASAVRRAIATVAGVDATGVVGETRLKVDLGFDSLMWVELAAALDELPGSKPSQDALAACDTVADLEALIAAPQPEVIKEPDVRDRVRIPAPVVPPLKGALGWMQRELYATLFDCEVLGRAFIPQNRPTIVVCNHASHLDMGLVKHALGPYGSKMVALAAKDYFFEGNDLWVAYFEQLTNLRPLDRDGGFRASYEVARGAITEGNVVLIFPEGTRRADGSLGEFKPLVGKLALDTGVDVLPMFLEGTYDALPRDAVLPRRRDLRVRIGPPIAAADLVRITAGLRPAPAARVATDAIRDAVSALRDHTVLDPASLVAPDPGVPADTRHPLEKLFGELPARFVPHAAQRDLCWYFSLGEEPVAKWTVRVAGGKVEVYGGKPRSGNADCVIKTSPEMMERILRQAYEPGPPEFFSGVIKTSDIPLLQQLVVYFRTGPSEGSP